MLDIMMKSRIGSSPKKRASKENKIAVTASEALLEL